MKLPEWRSFGGSVVLGTRQPCGRRPCGRRRLSGRKHTKMLRLERAPFVMPADLAQVTTAPPTACVDRSHRVVRGRTALVISVSSRRGFEPRLTVLDAIVSPSMYTGAETGPAMPQ